MFGNNYNMPYGMMPTGYPYNNNLSAPPPQTPNASMTNTNKIYVNGEDDARNRWLPPNSDYIFLDNDKAIIYQKIVDSKGQFEIKAFSITPYTPQTKTELDTLKEKIAAIELQLKEKNNGTNITTSPQREQETTSRE